MAPYIIKTFALLLGITLLGFASLQLNDPDPIAWAGFYGICALIPLLLVFNVAYRPLFLLALVLCCIRLGIAAPSTVEYVQYMAQEPLMQAMTPNKPYIEEAREFLGVLIALVIICSSTLLSKYVILSTKK